MNRNYLTGREGDKINVVLSAAGYNLRKLLRWLVFAPIFWLWQPLAVTLNIKTGIPNVPSQVARVGFAPAVI